MMRPPEWVIVACLVAALTVIILFVAIVARHEESTKCACIRERGAKTVMMQSKGGSREITVYDKPADD